MLKHIKSIFNLCHPQDIHECPQQISAHSVQPFGRPEGTLYKCPVLLYRWCFYAEVDLAQLSRPFLVDGKFIDFLID